MKPSTSQASRWHRLMRACLKPREGNFVKQHGDYVTPIQFISYYMAENLPKLVRIHRAAILSFSVSCQAKLCCGSLVRDGKLETIKATQSARSVMYLIDHILIVAIFLSGLKLKIPTLEMLIVHLTTDF